MKVLLVSRYVDPFSMGSNRGVYEQARSLKQDLGVDIEILTWPRGDGWSGPVPSRVASIPALDVVREGLPYHVFLGPADWEASANGNALTDPAWQEAVRYGAQLLKEINPDIVHLHHRHGLWWLLESAQRLGMPTVYTNHDWGVACLRTVLVMGDDTLCDGVVEPKKCAACIKEGRGAIGKANETLVETPVGERLVGLLLNTPLRSWLRKRGIVQQSALSRASSNQRRACHVMAGLQHCFTPSQFGKKFFTGLGVPSGRVTVLPWFHSPGTTEKTIASDQPFTISYIGRVSQEKGVHLIFDALEKLKDLERIQLRVAGANDSPYCKALKTRFPHSVGAHKVEWLGWSAVEPLFLSTDVSIVPSLWIDNTPLALIEALSYRVPVIATRVPPIVELVIEGKTGFLADYSSVESLADAIRRAVAKKAKIRAGGTTFPRVPSLREYCGKVASTYRAILGQSS